MRFYYVANIRHFNKRVIVSLRKRFGTITVTTGIIVSLIAATGLVSYSLVDLFF